MKIIETLGFKRLSYTGPGSDYNTQPGFDPHTRSPGLGKNLFAPDSGKIDSDDEIIKKWRKKRKKRKKKKLDETTKGML